jgi:hypothetical protein
MEIGTLEFDHQDFIKDRAGDDKLAIRFFRKARQDSEETQKQGRPIFKEEDYIQIVVPGDRTSAIVRPVGPADKARFEKQYAHWQKTQEEEMQLGTPLEAWGIMSIAQIEEYRYFGVRTIDQMAVLRDDVCGKIMGGTSLKQKAINWLAISKEDAPLKKVQAELDKRDNQIAALEDAVKKQAELLAELQAKVPAQKAVPKAA